MILNLVKCKEGEIKLARFQNSKRKERSSLFHNVDTIKHNLIYCTLFTMCGPFGKCHEDVLQMYALFENLSEFGHLQGVVYSLRSVKFSHLKKCNNR